MSKQLYLEKYTVSFFLLLWPFVPNCFQIFNSSVYNAFIVWKTASLFFVIFIGRKGRIDIDRYLQMLIISSFLLFLSTVINHGSISRLLGYVYDSIGIAVIIGYLYKKSADKFLKTTAMFFRVQNVICLVLFAMYPSGVFTTYSGFYKDFAVRYNYYGQDNQSGPIFLLFSVICIACDLYSNKKNNTLLMIDAMMLIVFQLLIFSGTALVGTAVFFFLWFMEKYKLYKMNRRFFLITLGIGLVFIVGLRGYRLFSFIITSLLGKDLTLSGRVYLWASALELWLKQPFWGYGIQETESLVYFTLMGDYRHAHNQYLQLLINGGILYTISFVLMITVVLKKINSIRKEETTYVMMAGLYAFFIMCMADAYGHITCMYFILPIIYYFSSYHNCINRINK